VSSLVVTTLGNGSKSVPVDTVVEGTAKAWMNLNGAGTVALRDSFNTSSVTDNGTGDYTQNFIAARPDANYAAFGLGKRDALFEPGQVMARVLSTTSFRINTGSGSFAYTDADIILTGVLN
jgi:hypothetical protein